MDSAAVIKQIAENALTRLRSADAEVEASGRAFLLGPTVFEAHLKRMNQTRLEELYRELGYTTDPDSTDGRASSGSPTGNQDPGQPPGN